MELDLEDDNPRMNAELGVMMAELYINWTKLANWIKLKTIPRDNFIHANWEEISHVNEN